MLRCKDGAVAALNNDVKSITIDQDLSIATYRFALAHESGHYYLHRDFITQLVVDGDDPVLAWRQHLLARDPKSLRDLERQADIFARGVLMPEATFIKEMKATEARLPSGKTWFTVTDIIFQAMLESLAKTFNVTASRVEYRLKDYGVNRD